MTAAYIYMLLRLPWLAPDITTAIVYGRQPQQLSAKTMLKASQLPANWTERKSWQPDGTAGLPSIGADIPTSPEWLPEHGKSFNQASGVRNVSFMRQAPKNETAAAAMIR